MNIWAKSIPGRENTRAQAYIEGMRVMFEK